MKSFIVFGVFAFVVQLTNQLPVKESKSTEKAPTDDPDSPTHNLENVIEYERYLKEVVGLLESDKEFRAKLDAASEADIRTGKIAQELELVDHNVRTKLDELKRTELERLRGLAREYYERTNEIDREHLKIAEHLDHQNEHTFEIDDLKRLIVKTGEDLAEADRQRQDEFKQYELQKEFEKQEKMRGMKDEEKVKFEEEIKTMTEKHNKHEKVHHPGSKDQLEEVWEKQDHMDPTDFDPKKFFMMHDVDGNGFWDEMEVKALFKTELDKVYQQGLPEDDMRERAEEMERMREHVYNEADQNHDRLISFDEFMIQTKKREFQQDEGWDTVDQQPQYSHDEYLEFERRRQEEVNRLIAEGRLPAHPNMPGGYYPPDPNGHYQVPQNYHPNEIPQNYHPNAVPQYNAPQYQAPHPNQQQHYQQPPNQQQHYQQPPNQQQQYNAPPPIQQHHAPPPNQQQYNAPPQNQQQQYQAPKPIPVQQHQQQMKQQYGEQQRVQAQHNQQMGQQPNVPNPPKQQIVQNSPKHHDTHSTSVAPPQQQQQNSHPEVQKSNNQPSQQHINHNVQPQPNAAASQNTPQVQQIHN